MQSLQKRYLKKKKKAFYIKLTFNHMCPQHRDGCGAFMSYDADKNFCEVIKSH